MKKRLQISVFYNFILLGLLVAFGISSDPARAEKISNPIAMFKGLDKITGETHLFHVYIDETVQFGSLQITPRVCFSRPPTETAQTTSFVEIDEITLDRKIKRVFTGWMFAASPGLHGLDHPVYDVWLTECRTTEPETTSG